MIGRLRGVLLDKSPPHLLVDIKGIGFEVEVPLTAFQHLPEVGDEVTLYTHWQVREDGHALYGFASQRERTLFRELIKVSGVGAKLALLLLSHLSVDALIRCIQNDEVRTLMRLPGIGRRTAERLVVELRDRFSRWSATQAQGGDTGPGADPAFEAVADAISALEALGYKPADAQRMVKAVESEGLTSEAIIRRALQASVR
ncbi:MAG: Holliday junction branch migration protein RuvA [Candidatus Competibacterales bacterium]